MSDDLGDDDEFADVFARLGLRAQVPSPAPGLPPLTCNPGTTLSCPAMRFLSMGTMFKSRRAAIEFLRREAILGLVRVSPAPPTQRSLCPSRTGTLPGPPTFNVFELLSPRQIGTISQCVCCVGIHARERWIAF